MIHTHWSNLKSGDLFLFADPDRRRSTGTDVCVTAKTSAATMWRPALERAGALYYYFEPDDIVVVVDGVAASERPEPPDDKPLRRVVQDLEDRIAESEEAQRELYERVETLENIEVADEETLRVWTIIRSTVLGQLKPGDHFRFLAANPEDNVNVVVGSYNYRTGRYDTYWTDARQPGEMYSTASRFTEAVEIVA